MPLCLRPCFGASGFVRARQIAQSAQRAVLDCQPYKLPAAKYSDWSEIDLVMDPAN